MASASANHHHHPSRPAGQNITPAAQLAGSHGPSVAGGSVAGSFGGGPSSGQAPGPWGGSIGGTVVGSSSGGGGGGAGRGAGGPPQQAPGGGAGPPNPKPIRRRLRMITSCLECRRRKLKCNRQDPCMNCQKFSRECVFFSAKLDERSQLRLTEIKEKVGYLERQLERDVKSSTRAPDQQRFVADDVEEDSKEEQDLEITPMVALDLTYDDDAEETPDVIDLGVQVGKMRITERIGGLNRPRISEEIQAGLSSGPQPNMEAMSEATGSEPSLPDFLRPGETYIQPTSGFFFGQVVQAESLAHFLPSRVQGDLLLERYWQAVHPIARCVHKPSFLAQYGSFWDDVSQGYEPRPSIQCIVFAAWFSAMVSLDEATIRQEFNYPKAHMVDSLKIGTESALSKGNFLRTTKIETMQGFVMYMIPLCRAEVSRAHSVLIGAAVRMAECMGLHRDGDAYGLTPLETHVRRLIWHQLCFLDIRTCEAQGPKPAIRREDYDTKLPLICEEDDLTHANVPPQQAQHWTSTLLPLMRFEINEMMRIIWVDRRKLENRKTNLSAVLTKVENFRKRMIDKYNSFLNPNVPIQEYARLVMNLLLYRLHAMVLHPYHSNAANPMPPSLNNILIISGVTIIDIAMQLENDPRFRDWSWYLGAYQQYQIALLLATEVYYKPEHQHAGKIWHCLDYVFITDPNKSRQERGTQILMEIMSKTAYYTGFRKMRAPRAIAKAEPNKHAVRPEGTAAAPGSAASADQAQVHMMPMAQYKPPQPPVQPTHPMQQPPIQPAYAAYARYPPPYPAQQAQQAQQPQMQGMGTGAPPMVAPHLSVMGMPPPGQPPNYVFAGVSNGEVLWSLPPRNPDSPENSSDGGSVVGQAQRHGSSLAMGPANVMENIDWDAINAVFPRNPQTGEIDFSSFVEPNLGMTWPN